MEEPLENRFILTSSLVSGKGFAFFMLGIHFGNPRLFFSSNPTGKQILCSIHKYKVSVSVYTFKHYFRGNILCARRKNIAVLWSNAIIKIVASVTYRVCCL